MKVPKANLLISELQKNPESFFNNGKSYDLLQEYFHDFPLDTLVKLLKDESLIVRRVAVWIVSELGSLASVLAEHIIPMLGEEDRYLKYYSLESLITFSSSGSVNLFHYLVSSLESDDLVIRKLGMYLISNASEIQLKEAMDYYSRINNQSHIEGLNFLINAEGTSENRLTKMLHNGNEISPRYVAVFLKRNINDLDQKIISIFERSDDDSIKMFLKEFFDETATNTK